LNSLASRCLTCVRLSLLTLLCFASPALAKLDYRVEIEAPRELKATLEKGLNLVRWRLDPDMDAERLKRLVDEAVHEAREAAATEGYFSAQVRAEVESAGDPWVVRLSVEPGERTRVQDVDIRFSGPATTDGEARPRLERVRQNWTLRPGRPFRQDDWEAAKRQAVRDLSGWRYAAASITDSRAAVDPQAQRASLFVEMASGPPFRFGELHVSGTRRYSDAIIENLVPVHPGETYDREKVILYQRRLLESGYFASVQAEIDAQPAFADAAPLRVAVIDAPKHHFESGIGYNTDVGARLQARYSNQDVLGTAWRFNSSLNLDQKIQSLPLEFNTPPRAGGVWNSFTARARQQDIQNQITREFAVGASQNYGASAAPTSYLVSAHSEDQRLAGGEADSAHAVYFGYRKSFRRTDALISPRQGYVLSGEVGGAPNAFASQQFVRGVASASLFLTLSRNDDVLLRGQAGAVRSQARKGIPSTFLFRTGGDQTVRGYAFESIGVQDNGAVVGGRRLLVGSIEYTRWIGESWGVAAFFDAGNAWDAGVRTDVATGYGIGARFRTPIGPIRADLAYGALTSDWRLHFSVGYGF
jgi:translocation and assembly module TamA